MSDQPDVDGTKATELLPSLEEALLAAAAAAVTPTPTLSQAFPGQPLRTSLSRCSGGDCSRPTSRDSRCKSHGRGGSSRSQRRPRRWDSGSCSRPQSKEGQELPLLPERSRSSLSRPKFQAQAQGQGQTPTQAHSQGQGQGQGHDQAEAEAQHPFVSHFPGPPALDASSPDDLDERADFRELLQEGTPDKEEEPGREVEQHEQHAQALEGEEQQDVEDNGAAEGHIGDTRTSPDSSEDVATSVGASPIALAGPSSSSPSLPVGPSESSYTGSSAVVQEASGENRHGANDEAEADAEALISALASASRPDPPFSAQTVQSLTDDYFLASPFDEAEADFRAKSIAQEAVLEAVDGIEGLEGLKGLEGPAGGSQDPSGLQKSPAVSSREDEQEDSVSQRISVRDARRKVLLKQLSRRSVKEESEQTAPVLRSDAGGEEAASVSRPRRLSRTVTGDVLLQLASAQEGDEELCQPANSGAVENWIPWCGRCPPQSVLLGVNAFPSRSKHAALHKSDRRLPVHFEDIRTPSKGSETSSRRGSKRLSRLKTMDDSELLDHPMFSPKRTSLSRPKTSTDLHPVLSGTASLLPTAATPQSHLHTPLATPPSTGGGDRLHPLNPRHWVQDLAELDIPISTTFAFSRTEHPTFKWLTWADLSNLELKLQQMVKKQRYLEEIAKLEEIDVRTDLESAALRIVLQKPAEERSKLDCDLLNKYLKSVEPFRDLPPVIFDEIGACLTFKRGYADDGVLCRDGAPVTHLYLVTAGKVVQTSGPFTVASGNCETEGVQIERSTKFVVGWKELLERGGLGDPWGWKSCCYAWSTEVAEVGLEAIALSVDDLQYRLQGHELSERVDILRLFPPTKNLSEADLRAMSRVVHKGKRVPLLDLFKVKELNRYHILHKQGEKPAPPSTFLYFIVSGEVQHKARGQVIETVSKGAILGSEALRDHSYIHTALVSSTKAKVLMINTGDFSVHFGRQAVASLPAHMDEVEKSPLQKESKWRKARNIGRVVVRDKVDDEVEDEDGQDGDGRGRKGRSSKESQVRVKELSDMLNRPHMLKEDLRQVIELEWKRLRPRHMHPKAMPPPGARVEDMPLVPGRGRLRVASSQPPKVLEPLPATLPRAEGIFDDRTYVPMPAGGSMPTSTMPTLTPIPKRPLPAPSGPSIPVSKPSAELPTQRQAAPQSARFSSEVSRDLRKDSRVSKPPNSARLPSMAREQTFEARLTDELARFRKKGGGAGDGGRASARGAAQAQAVAEIVRDLNLPSSSARQQHTLIEKPSSFGVVRERSRRADSQETQAREALSKLHSPSGPGPSSSKTALAT